MTVDTTARAEVILEEPEEEEEVFGKEEEEEEEEEEEGEGVKPKFLEHRAATY